MSEVVSILLVDDDIKNLLVLETILDAPEYHLVKAGSADEALMALMHEEFAAIILDVKMPDMSGIDLARLIKQRKKTQHIPILFLTAHYYEDEHIVLGYGAGAVDYITKPVNPNIVRSKIEVFVDLFRKTTALARTNAALESEIQDRQKAEERFRLVVEASPYAMIVFSRDGRISLINSRTELLFGYARDEILEESIWKLIPELVSKKNDSLEGQKNTGELVGTRKDGSAFPIEAVFSQFHADGTVFELVSLVDITERKRAEAALLATNEELAVKNAELERNAEDRSRRIHAEAARAEAEAANRAKDHFLAMLSHELRTPLSPVLHSVALIEEEEGCTPPIRELVETIRRNVQLEARLIDDLLDLSRIRHGKLQLFLESVDAHDLVRRAAQICETDLAKRSIKLSLQFGAARSTLSADQARLQQIFWNLLNNATKYTSIGGSVDVITDNPEEGILRVRVIDSGIGIEPSRLGKIFGAFEQAHEDRSIGLGLGLAICRALTELHHGTIEAASAGNSMGSCFTVLMPLAAPDFTEHSQVPGTESTPPVSFRILLVEDHEDTVLALKRLLSKRGHLVKSASSVAAALQLMGEFEFDLLLSDMGLPDGKGTDLMLPFLTAAGSRRVDGIALSGYGMPDDIQRSRDAGFSQHLTKPVDISRLQQCLASVARVFHKPE